MNIKYRQLKAFSLAAQSGSFAKAAAALCVTQPSFSVMIRELEHDLGMQLFERTTRSCRLTLAGASFYKEVEPILQNLQDAYYNAAETGAGRRGKLALAALPSLAFGFLTEVLGSFHKAHPGVRILMKEELNVSLIGSVKSGEVELGVGCQLTADPEVAFTPLFNDQLMVVAPAGHPVLRRPVRWESLQGHPLIMLALGSAERALQHNKLEIAPTFEVAYMGTAVGMVRHGMGVTVIPSSALDGLNMEGLHWAPMPGEYGRRRIGVLYRRRASLSAAARSFIDLLSASVPRRAAAQGAAPPARRRPAAAAPAARRAARGGEPARQREDGLRER